MATQRMLKRATALSLAGCGLALYAAQAGVLPGVDLNTAGTAERGLRALSIDAAQVPEPGTTPAALAALLQRDGEPDRQAASPSAGEERVTGYIPDAFAKLQTLHIPPRSGFSERPGIVSASRPGRPPGQDRPSVRPAAFSPAAPPARPDAPDAPPRAGQDRALSPLGLPCGLDVTLQAAPAAMIALGVAAPCHPGAEITVTHSDLDIAVRTDVVGLLTLDLPALESPARVTVRLPDGTEEAAQAVVPDLGDFERVALSWRGDLDMELHAIEAGAAWMSAGHLHRGAPRGPEAAANGGTFLTLLGEAGVETPRMAQVLTVPRGRAAGMSLSIDAPITQANCAAPAEAGILQAGGGRGVRMMPLRFTYPGCDAVGDTLVLQNVLRDPRLAAN